MLSEAEKYWLYSRECTLQALKADTEERRSRLFELARTWSEAAAREELHRKLPASADLSRGSSVRG